MQALSPGWLAGRLAALPRVSRYRVAFSGGADSLALLLLMSRAGVPGLEAVHVDHGLDADSTRWAAHCAQICERLGVAMHRVQVTVGGGSAGLEAAAREARYAALAALTAGTEAMCTAHHEDDQAETVLLALVRGSGPRGLGAMRPARRLGAGWLLRPLLTVPREALHAWLGAEAAQALHDPANQAERFARSHLRRTVVPALTARWPAAVQALARGARLQQEAARLLDVLADQDLAPARTRQPGRLRTVALRALDAERLRNALGSWLRGLSVPAAPARALHEAAERLAADSRVRVLARWPGAELRAYRGWLYALMLPGPPALDRAVAWQPGVALELAQGRLSAHPVLGQGLAAWRVPAGGLAVRPRRGGESFWPAGRRRPRSLKKLLQEAGVPPWERPRLPLIYAGEQLLAVPGLGVARDARARPHSAGWTLHWCALGTPAVSGNPGAGAGD